MTFEEILPHLKNGEKVRLNNWDKEAYIFINCGLCKDYNGDLFDFTTDDFFRNNWELYEEPIDWDYIIKNKCVCWIWDDDYRYRLLGLISKVDKSQERPFFS